MQREIDVQELKQRLDAGENLQLIDVREPWEHEIVHLEGATLMPASQLADRLKELDPDRPLILYCHHGIRSLHLAMALATRGFENAVSLRGGIEQWATDIDPSLPRY